MVEALFREYKIPVPSDHSASREVKPTSLTAEAVAALEEKHEYLFFWGCTFTEPVVSRCCWIMVGCNWEYLTVRSRVHIIIPPGGQELHWFVENDAKLTLYNVVLPTPSPPPKVEVFNGARFSGVYSTVGRRLEFYHSVVDGEIQFTDPAGGEVYFDPQTTTFTGRVVNGKQRSEPFSDLK